MSFINAARSGARTRVPRFAEAAVERARLTVVPQRSLGRTQARRTPFAVLVLAMLVAGVVGLLMFNTHMQQSSFTATALQDRVTTLTAQEQSLNMELDQLRDPQRLAKAAKRLRMVAPSTPAFLDMSTGRILGTPTAATSGDAVRINPLPAQLPKALARKTVIVKATPAQAARMRAEQLRAGQLRAAKIRAAQARSAQARSAQARTYGADTPGASADAARATGRKGTSTARTTSPTPPADSGATR